MKLSRLRFVAAAAVLFALSVPAFAWDAIGHMVIATIALNNLPPKVRAEALKILAAGGPDAPTDFVHVSTWADDTRTRQTGPWHYEDHHFRTDGQPVTTLADAENAVWAIEKFTKVLEDRSKPMPERAEALRYLIHFVGDIHQPLHATARDSSEHPNGDRGGNDYHILDPGFKTARYPVRNLHSLWDMGGGLFLAPVDPTPMTEAAYVQDLATRISEQYPRRSVPHERDADPEHWALESFQLAKDFVYSTPENKVPDHAYLDRTAQVSSERVAAAGYRLADLINRALR